MTPDERLAELSRRVDELAIRTATDIGGLKAAAERTKEDRQEVKDLADAMQTASTSFVELSGTVAELVRFKEKSESDASGRSISRREWITWGLGTLIALGALIVAVLALAHGASTK